MEKICIVKRRREYAQPEVKLSFQNIHHDTFPPEVVASSISFDNHPELSNKKIVEEFIDNSSSVISITMTKEQSALLQQSEYIKDLLNGTKNDPSLDIKLNDDGQLALNFRFNDSLLLRMLSPNQVCQMLQISRSFLQKLINEKKMNSYKLGRLRRFLLEDVLEYLSNGTEFNQFKNEQ
ncbi:MAG: helix-turn-helix domain-containing protein [Deltaproteobacteria bacterium]|nr:helix-turn-helix domain-containing protein [Deltaproteobacteria bacterium]